MHGSCRAGFDLGPEAKDDGEDFDGWAKWSGTSFSGPIDAATIAWEWMSRGNAGLPGDAAAWEELVRRYGKLVYSIAVRSGLSREDSDDVFQIVFTQVYRSLGLYDESGQLAAEAVETLSEQHGRRHADVAAAL